MEAKERAIELYEKCYKYADDGGYYDDISYNEGGDKHDNAKKLALIAWNEVTWFMKHYDDYYENSYIKDVEQEIKKL